MEFRILGPLEVVVAGRPVGLGGARHERILAALLLAAGRPVSVTRLAEVAYDDPLDGSRRQVQNRISALRALLAKADHGNAGGELIVRQGNGYLLRTTREQVDAFVFDDLTAQARTLAAAGDRVGAARLLRRALALWRGPALDGLDCRPLHRQVAGLDEARLAAWEDCLDLELATAVDTGPFIAELRTLVARHPSRQRLTGLLMTALHRAGRQADALSAYRELAARLADEHGLDPARDLQDLYRAVLRDDVPRPPAEAGPPTGQDQRRSVPAQLPAAVHGFTGRVAHLDALDNIAAAAIGRPTAVVVTAVSGTAGVGKTALAVHWAHRVRATFPDGQLYVNLRGYDTGAPLHPGEALSRFLRGLGVPAERVPGGVEEAAAMYRSHLADKRMLVLLDNAATAEQVRPLLPGSATCLVLITSRDRLAGLIARDGAHELTLEVLSAAEAHDLLGGLLGPARAAGEPDAVAELCRLCAYLPLALRIAAASLLADPHRPVAEYVDDIRTGDRLTALAIDGDEDAAVRAAFDLSYVALPTEARRLFRLIGLLPGPDITAETAAVPAGTSRAQALRVLRRLASAHLVNQVAADRFTCHDLLRVYAAERAGREDGAADRRAALDRLVTYYLSTVDAAARMRYPETLRLPAPADIRLRRVDFGSAEEAGGWLEANHANLVDTVKYLADQGPRCVCWLLADWLRGYFDHFAADPNGWRAVADAALAAAEDADDRTGEAAAQLSLAALATRLSHYRGAARHGQRALALAQRLELAYIETAALAIVGRSYTFTGPLDRAVQHYTEALRISHRNGASPDRGLVLLNLGYLSLEQGHLTRGLQQLTDAVHIFHAAAAPRGLAHSYNIRGWILHLLGRHEEAAHQYDQAAALCRDHRLLGCQADQLCLQAEAYLDHARHADALRLAEASLAISRDTGDRGREVNALKALGTVWHRLGRPHTAATWFRRALALAESSRARRPLGSALIGLSTTHRHRAQSDRARTLAQRAIDVTHRAGFTLLEAEAHTELAAAHLACDDAAAARQHAQHALTMHQYSGWRPGQARAMLLLAHASRHTDTGTVDPMAATTLLNELGMSEADETRALLHPQPVPELTEPTGT